MPSGPAGGIIGLKDGVTDRLNLINPNLRTSMGNAVLDVTTKVVNAMQKRVREAATPTGERRARGEAPRFSRHSDGRSVMPAWGRGQGPGRVESGGIINSIYAPLSGRGTVELSGQVGFVNPPAYLAYQEKLPGTDGTPMGAVPVGRAVLSGLWKPTMAASVGNSLEATKSGRTVKPADTPSFRGR